MKLKSKKTKKISKKKLTIIIVLVFSIAVIAFLSFWLLNKNQNSADLKKGINEVDYSSASDDQITNGSSIKENSYSNDISGSDQPNTPKPIEGSTKSNVETYITYATQENPGGVLKVGTEISSVQSTGQCTLTLSSSGQKPIIVSSDIQPLAKTSTCKGFTLTSIPVGQWTASLKFDNDSLTGTATYNSITVK